MSQALWEALGVVLVAGWLHGKGGPWDRGGWMSRMGNGREVVDQEGWTTGQRWLRWEEWAMEWRLLPRRDEQQDGGG